MRQMSGDKVNSATPIGRPIAVDPAAASSSRIEPAVIKRRKPVKPRILSIPIIFAIAICTSAQLAKLSPNQAKDHIGEVQTVCGKVVSTRFASNSKGQPTFLNLDKPYPNEVFTILIWGENRSKFETPETKYNGTNVCVSGRISVYHGTPEIVATNPDQMTSAK
jgi:hypothetical protein